MRSVIFSQCRGRRMGVDHQLRVVCCNAENLNFGMQNLCPSNVKVIFQWPSCGYSYSCGFEFYCRYSARVGGVAQW